MDTSSILQTIPSQCGDYGEILVADAFHGEKKGYAQPCYDVESTESYVRAGLRRAGASPAP